MIYKFRRDWMVIALTVLVALVLLYVLYDVYFVKEDMADRIAAPIISVLIGFFALRTPRYFYIEKDRIVVKFFIGCKVLEDVQSDRKSTR